jgi:hypothetical protein
MLWPRMLKATIDESRSDDRSPVLSVGCCLGEAAQWRRFLSRWAPYAAKYPKGFHATKARDAENEALFAIMKAELPAALAVTINYEDTKSIVPPKLRGRFGEEYATCIRAVVFHGAGYDRHGGCEGRHAAGFWASLSLSN